jgi:hypothetical protein
MANLHDDYLQVMQKSLMNIPDGMPHLLQRLVFRFFILTKIEPKSSADYYKQNLWKHF